MSVIQIGPSYYPGQMLQQSVNDSVDKILQLWMQQEMENKRNEREQSQWLQRKTIEERYLKERQGRELGDKLNLVREEANIRQNDPAYKANLENLLSSNAERKARLEASAYAGTSLPGLLEGLSAAEKNGDVNAISSLLPQIKAAMQANKEGGGADFLRYVGQVGGAEAKYATELAARQQGDSIRTNAAILGQMGYPMPAVATNAPEQPITYEKDRQKITEMMTHPAASSASVIPRKLSEYAKRMLGDRAYGQRFDTENVPAELLSRDVANAWDSERKFKQTSRIQNAQLDIAKRNVKVSEDELQAKKQQWNAGAKTRDLALQVQQAELAFHIAQAESLKVKKRMGGLTEDDLAKAAENLKDNYAESYHTPETRARLIGNYVDALRKEAPDAAMTLGRKLMEYGIDMEPNLKLWGQIKAKEAGSQNIPDVFPGNKPVPTKKKTVGDTDKQTNVDWTKKQPGTFEWLFNKNYPSLQDGELGNALREFRSGIPNAREEQQNFMNRWIRGK